MGKKNIHETETKQKADRNTVEKNKGREKVSPTQKTEE